MASVAKLKEKRQAEVMEIRRQDPNKTCAECNERSPQNAIFGPDFAIFVCMMCSGIHREFNHRMKGLTTSDFTDDEVAALRACGNGVVRTRWMARFRDGEFQLPDHMEVKTARERRTREFIRMKYVDRRWIEKPNDPHASTSAAKKGRTATGSAVPRLTEEPQLRQLSEVLPDIGHLVVSENTEKKKKKKKPVDDTNGQSSAAVVAPPSSTSNGHTTTAPVISAPATAPTTRTRVASVAAPVATVTPQASILDFDVFGTAAPAPQPVATQQTGGGGGGAVTTAPANGGDWANFESAKPAVVDPVASALASAFGPSSSAPVQAWNQTGAYGVPQQQMGYGMYATPQQQQQAAWAAQQQQGMQGYGGYGGMQQPSQPEFTVTAVAPPPAPVVVAPVAVAPPPQPIARDEDPFAGLGMSFGTPAPAKQPPHVIAAQQAAAAAAAAPSVVQSTAAVSSPWGQPQAPQPTPTPTGGMHGGMMTAGGGGMQGYQGGGGMMMQQAPPPGVHPQQWAMMQQQMQQQMQHQMQQQMMQQQWYMQQQMMAAAAAQQQQQQQARGGAPQNGYGAPQAAAPAKQASNSTFTMF